MSQRVNPVSWLAWAGASALLVVTTRNPLYRAWRHVLPDLRQPDGTTGFVYAAWVVVLAGLAWWGWRSARGDEDAGAGERADADRPAVDVQREGAVG